MPLDKMPDPEGFAPTHKSAVLHIRGNPISCVVDPSPDMSEYDIILHDPDPRARLTGFLNKDDELGLLLGLKLLVRCGKASAEYVVYPDEGFVDALILNEVICIIDSKMEQLLSLKINTDQFVKTKYEFDRFRSTGSSNG